MTIEIFLLLVLIQLLPKIGGKNGNLFTFEIIHI